MFDIDDTHFPPKLPSNDYPDSNQPLFGINLNRELKQKWIFHMIIESHAFQYGSH